MLDEICIIYSLQEVTNMQPLLSYVHMMGWRAAALLSFFCVRKFQTSNFKLGHAFGKNKKNQLPMDVRAERCTTRALWI